MYARAVNVQFQSGKIQEASRIVKDSIVPAMQKQKGFKGQLFLTQPETGKAISINLWETQDDLTLFEASPLYRELMGNLAEVLAGPPTGERYEVSAILVQT